jgi:hypothetical protein
MNYSAARSGGVVFTIFSCRDKKPKKEGFLGIPLRAPLIAFPRFCYTPET